MTLEVSEAAKDLLMEKGFDQIYGARPMRRAIMTLIEDPLAEGLLHGKFQPGDHVVADAKDGAMVLNVTNRVPSEEVPEAPAEPEPTPA
jgi:ATP-dependent Clp protease ATP-binding subunit ClpC